MVGEDGEVRDVLHWGVNYRLLQCLGCESISLETRTWDSIGIGRDGEPVESVDVFPPRAPKVRFLDGAISYLPHNIYRAYQEVTTAFVAGVPILTAIGLRSLVEAVCQERKAEGRDLIDKIENLAATGVISQDQAATLHHHRSFGNAAAHELVAPRPQELESLLEIVQHLLVMTYRVPFISERINSKEGRSGPKKVRLTQSP